MWEVDDNQFELLPSNTTEKSIKCISPISNFFSNLRSLKLLLERKNLNSPIDLNAMKQALDNPSQKFTIFLVNVNSPAPAIISPFVVVGSELSYYPNWSMHTVSMVCNTWKWSFAICARLKTPIKQKMSVRSINLTLQVHRNYILHIGQGKLPINFDSLAQECLGRDVKCFSLLCCS